MAEPKYLKWIERENLDKITDWARDGLSDEQIAASMQIGRTTFYRWENMAKEEGSELKCIWDAITRGRSEATDVIENAVYQRAQTQVVKVKKPIKVRVTEYDERGRRTCEREEIQMIEEEVVVPGDTKAAIFWLANRRRSQWQSVNGTIPAKSGGKDGDDSSTGVVMMPSITPITPPDDPKGKEGAENGGQ